MALDDLGLPLTNAYSIVGGQARLYQRGLTVVGSGNEVVVRFAFPMIAQPRIVTGESTATPLFALSAVSFVPGSWTVDEVVPLIQDALRGRLGLVPTGQPAAQVPLIAGQVSAWSTAGDTVVAYGVAVTAAIPLQERQLYDVAVLGDGDRWHVVAPHAVYYRRDWTDFGLAHITDMHVARRIDRFRGLLAAAGRTEAARLMFNWNDRFRGFVRYANHLHDTGVLDVIVATGDLYDYQFEDDDDPASGGNAAFLRRLILGQAPGPDFPDVEALRVPIFMVPGNHDYRIHPYKLVFDVHIGGSLRAAAIAAALAGPLSGGLGPLGAGVGLGAALGPLGATLAHAAGFIAGLRGADVARLRSSSGYHLTDDDATFLTNQLDGRSGTEVQDHSQETAERMVAIDPHNQPYKTFLANTGSYIVSLGPHRIAMLDSAHDLGVVTEMLAALVVKMGQGSEDQSAFVGGSPNCKGITGDDLDVVTAALAATPDEGLFIVGLHAPLFNPPNDECPYFLRETQRAAHADQDHPFLVRHGQEEILPFRGVDERVEARHPSWFAGATGRVRDHRRPRFVKRVDSQDLLEHGVSRGHADELMKQLAGAGSVRPADVVLAGHTHCHNEFSVRPMAHSGELAFYMDFYTQNPGNYYPATFTRGWTRFTREGSPDPVLERTYIEVVPGAQPDAAPWPMPFDALTKNMLQVPPYPNPLSAAADPRAWWSEHRPLVLQTGPLGPLKSLSFFSGFRVLAVKNNVIDKVHFVPIERLEASQYRLSWDEAIRPEPVRHHRYVERSRPLGAPRGVGAPAAIAVPTLAATNVVYRDRDGRLHELWQKGSDAGTSDLTTLGDNAIPAADDPTLYIDTTEGLLVALYRGTDNHVYSLYWSTGAVGRDALSGTAGAPRAAGNPVGYVGKDGVKHAIYRAEGGHLHELWWTGPNPPGHGAITGDVAPAAKGDPAAYINTATGENVVIYRGSDDHVHGLYWLTGAVRHDDLSGYAQAPEAAGDPVAYYTGHDDTHQVIYRSADGHLHELWWRGNNPVAHRQLTAATAGAPVAANGSSGDPAAYYCAGSNTKHVIYRSADGRLNQLWWSRGAPKHVDLSAHAVAPLAADKPAAFAAPGTTTQHVVYRGKDDQIHELRWTQAVVRRVPDPREIGGMAEPAVVIEAVGRDRPMRRRTPQ